VPGDATRRRRRKAKSKTKHSPARRRLLKGATAWTADKAVGGAVAAKVVKEIIPAPGPAKPVVVLAGSATVIFTAPPVTLLVGPAPTTV
jgi:hypothetical protein